MHLQASRVFLMACAPTFVPVAALLWFTRQPGEWMEGWPPAALALLISVLALLRLALLSRAPRRREQPLIALGMMTLVLALPVAAAVSRDLGLWSLCLPLMSLVIAFATGLLGLVAGVVLTLLGGLALAGLGAGEALGWATHPMGATSLWLRAIVQFGLLGSGLVAGLGMLKMVKRSLAEADERTARFRGLLGMAVDWYWEMDREFRFTHVAEERPGASGLDLNCRLGKTPWELDGMMRVAFPVRRL